MNGSFSWIGEREEHIAIAYLTGEWVEERVLVCGLIIGPLAIPFAAVSDGGGIRFVPFGEDKLGTDDLL